jgi:hypothetical protein
MRPRILPVTLCALAALLGPLAAASSAQDDSPGVRLLNGAEGLTLVNTAAEQRAKPMRKPDCSHLVHQIYVSSGFPYPYASSFDLYDGIDNFRRISTPRSGDLVVWRGHVGIVTDAAEHTFYSSVSSGLRTEYYDSEYWKAQGRPRFYRYVLPGHAGLTAGNAFVPVNDEVAQAGATVVPVRKEIADEPTAGASLPAKAVSPALSTGPAPPLNHSVALPSSIMVVAAGNWPTEEEIGEAISEFNSGTGNLLRGWPAANPKRTVMVYDQLRVKRVDLKRDRGHVNAEVDGRLSIGGKEIEGQRRTEKMVCELRRTPQGWQLQMPANRAYVPRDVAVRILAGQLAFLTQTQAAPNDLDRSQRQQSEIVHALGFLFDAN